MSPSLVASTICSAISQFSFVAYACASPFRFSLRTAAASAPCAPAVGACSSRLGLRTGTPEERRAQRGNGFGLEAVRFEVRLRRPVPVAYLDEQVPHHGDLGGEERVTYLDGGSLGLGPLPVPLE